jgi:hypothetical protein
LDIDTTNERLISILIMIAADGNEEVQKSAINPRRAAWRLLAFKYRDTILDGIGTRSLVSKLTPDA